MLQGPAIQGECFFLSSGKLVVIELVFCYTSAVSNLVFVWLFFLVLCIKLHLGLELIDRSHNLLITEVDLCVTDNNWK